MSGEDEAITRRVASDYMENVESQLGSASEVARCLAAWERELSMGILELTRTEIVRAADWRAAHTAAYRRATDWLESESDCEITITLLQVPR